MLLLFIAALVIQPDAAASPPTCTAGADCEAKWGRALRWVLARNPTIASQTDSLIVTGEPLGGVHKYQVARIADGGGRYTIDLRTACAPLRRCNREAEKRDFAAAVMSEAP